MKNKINMTFLAFLAWMATLLAITCVNAFGQCDYLESNNNMGHVEHLPPAYKTASAVAMAKAIVWNNIHFVTVDYVRQAAPAKTDRQSRQYWAYHCQMGG